MSKGLTVAVDPFIQSSDEDDPSDDGSSDRLVVDETVIDDSQARGLEEDIVAFLTATAITEEKEGKGQGEHYTANGYERATNVQTGLTERSAYKLKAITVFKTRHYGKKQVWTMEEVVSKLVSRVWAPWVLTQHTYGNSGTEEIEPRNVQILKCLDITYKGSTSDDNDKIRYDFAFSRA
mgnify:FL=1